MQIKLISFFLFTFVLFGQNSDDNFWKVSNSNNDLKIESQDHLQSSYKTILNFDGHNLKIYIKENNKGDRCVSIWLYVERNINNHLSFKSELKSFAYGCKIPCMTGSRINQETQKKMLKNGLSNLYLLPDDIKKKIRDHIAFLGINI